MAMYTRAQLEVIVNARNIYADGASEEFYRIRLDGTDKCKGELLIFYACAAAEIEILKGVSDPT